MIPFGVTTLPDERVDEVVRTVGIEALQEGVSHTPIAPDAMKEACRGGLMLSVEITARKQECHGHHQENDAVNVRASPGRYRGDPANFEPAICVPTTIAEMMITKIPVSMVLIPAIIARPVPAALSEMSVV